MQHNFKVVIERDAAGWLVASVSELQGCHTQARFIEELEIRIAEAISLCVEEV